MKKKIKKFIKKTINIIKKPFIHIKYVDCPIYSGKILSGRTALITGGSSGIGLAIAKAFVTNGANVIITGRNTSKLKIAVKELNKEIKDSNIVLGFELDISDVENIERSLSGIIKKVDFKIDILVNNAGIISGNNIGETSITDFEKCLKTNLEGLYFVSQFICTYMKKNNIKGNVLNICSSSSVRPAVNPYTISKWGEKGLTLGMAKKYIKDGIVVNGIAPGPTFTSMLVNNDEENLFLDSSPCKRYIMPEEIANGALFLVSDMGRMIVGDIIYMTGGAGVITFDDIEY